MEKIYKEPKFEFVRTDERSRVFFASSGTPGAGSTLGGSISSMGSITGAW